MKRAIGILLLSCCLAYGTFFGVFLTEGACEGVFVDYTTITLAGDPPFLADPNNQVRLYKQMRVGENFDLTFTACDPDGDPVGSVVPYQVPPDLTYVITGATVNLQYKAKGQSHRDVIAFKLSDVPPEMNAMPASRVATIVVDVRKNRAPLWP